MYDRETNSLWVHATGRAEYGPLKGKRLTFMPSTVTTWANWKQAFPQTLVLPGHRRGGFMGTYKGLRGNRKIGLALVVRFKAKLYPFAVLERRPVVNDRFNGEQLLVFYSEDSGTATAWKRKTGGRVLTFELAGRKDRFGKVLLRDKQTASLWSWLTGEAVQGRLKGSKLGRAMYNPILNDRFRAFYPGAPIYGAR